MVKIIIFGTGLYSEQYSRIIPKEDIVCYVDNNIEKDGTEFFSRPVMLPSKADYSLADYVVIMVLDDIEIVNQLKGLMVPDNKIIHYYDFAKVMQMPVRISTNNGEKDAESWHNEHPGKRLFLCVHDFDRTGVPVVMMHLAKLLQEENCSIVYGAVRNGTMVADLQQVNIDYIENIGLMESSDDFIRFIKGFDAVIFGTVTVGRFAHSLSYYDKPIFYWINESYDDLFQLHKLPPHRNNMYYLTEGDETEYTFKKFYPERQTSQLLYFLPENIDSFPKEKHNDFDPCHTVHFAIIGTISKRKGQDIFLEAIKKIPNEYKEHMAFLVVGAPYRDLNIDWDEICAVEPRVEYLPEISQEELEKLYMRIDVLVCASREDSNPVVVTQAFQNSLPCIVSSGVGQSRFMSDGYAGFVFENGDASDLARKMIEYVQNAKLIEKQGNQGRKIFEDCFSEDAARKVIRKEVLSLL